MMANQITLLNHYHQKKWELSFSFLKGIRNQLDFCAFIVSLDCDFRDIRCYELVFSVCCLLSFVLFLVFLHLLPMFYLCFCYFSSIVLQFKETLAYKVQLYYILLFVYVPLLQLFILLVCITFELLNF